MAKQYPFAQLAKGHGLFGARHGRLPHERPAPQPIDPRRLRRWRIVAWLTAMAVLPINALLVVVLLVAPAGAAPPSIPLLMGMNLVIALPVALKATSLLPYHPSANLVTSIAAATPVLSLAALISLVVRLRPTADPATTPSP
ncbi:MAG: hypothetical protein AAGK09_07050 [Planctomycetota bacterium]